ncbi:MAG: hypothetical protein WBH49_04495 [Flavobacteriaceae bacterium]|jgi:hypothetical protein
MDKQPSTKYIREWCRTNYGKQWYNVTKEEKKRRKAQAIKSFGWLLENIHPLTSQAG